MAEGMGNGLSNEHGGGRNKRGFKGARLVLQGGYGVGEGTDAGRDTRGAGAEKVCREEALG